ncbi:unnamed protein product [Polarella glacialis]|uniref:Uncharacterized protein n=1 Tax=Polarella glacialis TaxID=89957 RepID=A0A813HMB7_POLGL|nr:unnamed protein product [Polarella glacialis]
MPRVGPGNAIPESGVLETATFEVEEVRIACATSPKGFELKAVVKEAGVKLLPPSAPKTVVTGASAELRHALDGLEARSAVEDHLEDARVMHAEQQMATAQSRRNELERARGPSSLFSQL